MTCTATYQILSRTEALIEVTYPSTIDRIARLIVVMPS